MTETRTVRSVLEDGFERIHDGVPAVVEGLSTEELLWRPDADANHIAWLVWHLSRQQDEQLAHLAGRPSAWSDGGWADRFALPYPPRTHGYGMSSREVGAFALSDPTLLTGYHQDVHDLTLALLAGLPNDRLGEVIDSRWDPPVTVAVRIVSVLDDAAKHLGQAEYVRGLVLRRRSG
jgi:hypothetical protein